MIKSSTLQESKFLHSIGSSAAEREEKIIDRVLNKAKQEQQIIAEESGVRTSLNEEDIKEYVKQVGDRKTAQRKNKRKT